MEAFTAHRVRIIVHLL